MLLGASMVKYTTPLPSIGLSESVSQLYINFEFYERRNHKHLKNTFIHKAEQFIVVHLQFHIQDSSPRLG